MRKVTGLHFIFTITFLLISCQPQFSDRGVEPLASTRPDISASTRAAWEADWEATLERAKKEGKVVIYSTAGSDVRALISRRFKERHGLDAEFIAGRGPELAQKLLTERRAGLYLGDLYMAGATTIINTLKPNKILDPLRPVLILPEVTDTKSWYQDRLPFNDKDDIIMGFRSGPSVPLAINTTLVKEGEIKSYQDLLNPKWKGKIILNDPTMAGTGLRWFSVVSNVILNMDYMYQLARQELVITRDQQQQVQWLSLGKYAIAIAPKTDAIGEFERAGAPLKGSTPVEGSHLTSGAGNMALINKSPHPQAARIFVNWFLIREIQYEYSKLVLAQSAREDVPADHLDILDRRQPGIKYFNSEDEDFLKKEPENTEKAREVFSRFIR